MNHIELFAGCGGLTLGLESAGFELVLANELSPMAGETFAYNFFEEDLTSEVPRKTKWLSSNFSDAEMAKRLREDPRTFPGVREKRNYLRDLEGAEGGLIIGSIVHLNDWLRESNNKKSLELLRSGFNRNGVDLVSGGPPCQSFSMAGMRDYNNSRNVLPWEFAKFVEMIQPRFALLENVTGILRPFNVGDKKVYAWYEVAKAFAEVDYVPLCLHVNAKFAGVAQNRPRFIMVLFRRDIFESIKHTFNSAEQRMLSPSWEFFSKFSSGIDTQYGDLPFFDAAKGEHLELFLNSFLLPLVEKRNAQCGVKAAIDDLKQNKRRRPKSPYVKMLNKDLGEHAAHRYILEADEKPNHVPRDNKPHTMCRFRIYQVISQVSKRAQSAAQKIIAGAENHIDDELFNEFLGHEFIDSDGKIFTPFYFTEGQKDFFVEFLAKHKTKKQTQKALEPNFPAPAALSIPDDACHYEELRTLTVREMARIQSFPDNFVFRSKVTTGGQMRRFEVPQYTQVGNAVPPLLGRSLGMVFKELITRANNIPPVEATKKSRRRPTLAKEVEQL